MAAVRFQDKRNYYYVEFGGDGTVKIIQEFDDGDSELASVESERVAVVNQWITLRVVAQGSALSAYLDDMLVASGTADATIAAGGIALGVSENAAVEFDDVLVKVP
jgi:hypothetical protein